MYKDNNGFSPREEFTITLNDLARMYGKSQADLCEETGISRTAMSQYFNGTRYPRPEQLKLLADCFGLTTSQLVGNQPAEAERINDLPIELRIIARRGRGLSPNERTALLRYCMYMWPDIFAVTGEDDEDPNEPNTDP